MARPVRHKSSERTPPRRVTVVIDDIGAGGDGVATLDGARVFVPLTAPGDVAVIDLRGERGVLLSLENTGPDRAAPPCRHYGACGGCSLQHLSRARYRRWKRERVIGALARKGFDPSLVAGGVETPTASRRRVAFSVVRNRNRAVLGFNARRSAETVDIEDCVVLAPGLAAHLSGLKALARLVEARRFDLLATLCDNGLDVVIDAPGTAPAGPALARLIEAARSAGVVRLSFNQETLLQFAAPVVRFDGVAVTPPAGGFLQASREGEAALIALVKEAAAGARRIADLFCGCGTFSLPLAKTAHVAAYDSDAPAIDALSKAAGAAQAAMGGLNPVRAERRDLFERPLTARELKSYDAVIFDPPRAGAAAQAAQIASSGVPLIIAVSCNPSTFACDAATLRAGGYALTKATPVDQFVFAPHVELVGVFRKA